MNFSQAGSAITGQQPRGFAALLDLARENSSERRRELLRQVTNAFMEGEQRNDRECLMFEDIVEAVSPSLSLESRAEISEKVADTSLPLRRTARNFAHDEIEVARPVLQRSRALTDEDMVEVARKKSQDHLYALTKRPVVGERVSGALVNYGHDHVVGSLLENDGSRINRPSYEKIAQRAESSNVLQKPFIDRQSSPLDLLGDLSVSVGGELRDKIHERLNSASPEQMQQALKSGKEGSSPADIELLEAKRWIESAKKRRVFGPASLVELLRTRKMTHFVVALAHICQVRIDIVRRAVDACNLDTLALLMKSAEISRPVFNTVAMLLAEDGSGIDNAGKYARIYQDVPAEAAQRAMRFWKVREKVRGQAL